MKKLIHLTAITAALALALTGCAKPEVKVIMPEDVVEQEAQVEEAETPAEPELTVSQQNAIKKAESYLSVMPFSRTGLIDQLVHEQFPQADAEFGVDAINADWNEQAALKAESYLDVMAFSRQSLIDQLMHEGFTQEQAEHGVNSVGL